MPVLQDFVGLWRLERRITDARGPQARFSGTACFTRDAAGLQLDETGELQLAGQGRFQAERRYLWRQAGPEIAVFFADGRAFHRFTPTAARTEAAHWCDPDTYNVRYDFGAWPCWHAVWTVSGPRKDYVMQSRYDPMPDPDRPAAPA
jgi:hypothetical protein